MLCSVSWDPLARSLPQDPSASIPPQMEHTLRTHPSCLPLRGQLPTGAPAWNNLGVPHPTAQNL